MVECQRQKYQAFIGIEYSYLTPTISTIKSYLFFLTMTKKSPIKNLVSSVTGVHRSTLSQLLDSASNAVQQGAQLSQHVVASSSAATKRKQQPKDKSAAAPPEDYLSWTSMKRRQDIDRKTIQTTSTASTPPNVKSGTGGGVRVRDAIHMFDTAASSKKNTKGNKSPSPSTIPSSSSSSSTSSTNKYASSYHATASFRHSPYRKHRGIALKKNDEVESKTNSNNYHYTNDDDNINSAKGAAMEHHRHKSSTNHHYHHEKENEINNPTNIEKDRLPLLPKQYKESAPLAATVAAPTSTANSHASPKKSNHRHQPTASNEREKTTKTMLDSVASKCTSSVQQHDGTKVDEVRGKRENNDVAYRSKQHGKKDEVEEAACMTVEEQETTTTTSKKRESPTNATIRDETTVFSSVGGTAATTSKQNKHPLIQSPLRKHIKIVHDSACANASCTMIKEPFPLLLLPPPLQSHQQQRQQLSSGGNGGEERQTTSNHLHTLDILTSNATATIAASTTGHRMNNDDQDDEGCSTKTKEEEAIDLLTTASFLFKQSRRKLG
ncbi:hypothetical protein ACHAXH_001143 [Discostella pseudostelligera]